MNKMNVKFCLDYLNYAVKEGFVDEDFAEQLMDRPYPELIEWTKRNIDLGDAYAEAFIKGEL